MADTPLWMPLYVDDYMGATQRLTCEQHGAYLLLIMDYWRNGPPPDDDDVLMQIVRLDRARWRKHRPVLAKLFQIEGGEWRHKRVDAELDRGRQVIEQKREAGRRSAEARKASKTGNGRSTGVATDVEQACQREGNQPQPQPQPQLQKGEEEGENSPLPHRALAFSGRVIRLNRRDFDQWATTYHAIPDLRAELTALDDWLRESADPQTHKRWFHVVSGALSKKHQRALAEASKADDGEWEMPVC
jgi:uncharacterized protein YdaU (DUF1376 family)